MRSSAGRPAIALVMFGVLYVTAFAVLGSTPGTDDSGQQIITWLYHHRTNVHIWGWCLTASFPLLAYFTASARRALSDPLATMFTMGATALIAETAIEVWIWLGLSLRPHDQAPTTARTLVGLASYWGPVLTTTTLIMLLPLVALAAHGPLPWWVGLIAGTAALEQSVETITIFESSGFTAPGGPMNSYLGAAMVASALASFALSTTRSHPPVGEIALEKPATNQETPNPDRSRLTSSSADATGNDNRTGGPQ